MEKRRMRAAGMFGQSTIPAEVARRLGVSHQIVSEWRAAWRRSGRDGLHGAGRAGRRPKVSREQLVYLEAELLKGGEAHGYPNELWSLQRVAAVIERMTRGLPSRTDVAPFARRPGLGSDRHVA
jgi:transposase